MLSDKNLKQQKIYAANANQNVSALNIRSGAGTSNSVMKVVNKNQLIGYATGYYQMNGSTKWIQVGFPDDMSKAIPKAVYGWASYAYISVGSPSAPNGSTPANNGGQGGGLIPNNDVYDITEETIFEDLEKKDKWKWAKIAGGILLLGGATTTGILIHRNNKKKKLKQNQTKK